MDRDYVHADIVRRALAFTSVGLQSIRFNEFATDHVHAGTPSLRDIVFHTQWCAALSMIAVQWPMFTCKSNR